MRVVALLKSIFFLDDSKNEDEEKINRGMCP